MLCRAWLFGRRRSAGVRRGPFVACGLGDSDVKDLGVAPSSNAHLIHLSAPMTPVVIGVSAYFGGAVRLSFAPPPVFVRDQRERVGCLALGVGPVLLPALWARRVPSSPCFFGTRKSGAVAPGLHGGSGRLGSGGEGGWPCFASPFPPMIRTCWFCSWTGGGLGRPPAPTAAPAALPGVGCLSPDRPALRERAPSNLPFDPESS